MDLTAVIELPITDEPSARAARLQLPMDRAVAVRLQLAPGVWPYVPLVDELVRRNLRVQVTSSDLCTIQRWQALIAAHKPMAVVEVEDPWDRITREATA